MLAAGLSFLWPAPGDELGPGLPLAAELVVASAFTCGGDTKIGLTC